MRLLYLVFVMVRFLQQTSATSCDETFENLQLDSDIMLRRIFILTSTLTCSNVSDITDLPLPPKYRHIPRYYEQILNITNSDVPNLPNHTFARFYHIWKLDLSGIHLRTIEGGAFKNMTQLRQMLLSKNELTDVVDVFSPLHNLQRLDLSENKIHRIDQFSFSNVPTLNDVNLARNALLEVADNLFQNQSYMYRLDLTGNPLNKLPNITTSWLGLSNVSLTKVEQNLSTWKVYTLDLSHNRLEKINFSFIPSSVFILNLSNNNISLLENVDILASASLHLSNNQIRSLNGSFGNIRDLDVSGNKIEVLEGSLFNNSKQVFDLNFCYNAISTLSQDVFLGLDFLRTLRLGHNRITKIFPGMFRDLGHVYTLDLSSNAIQAFPLGSFEGLSTLYDLNISNNKILALNSYTLHPLGHLVNLQFDNNAISSLDVEDLVTKFSTLRTVLLHRNQWRCQDLAVTFEVLTKHGVRIPAGEDFNGPNVHGVACSEENETTINKPELSFADFQGYVRQAIDSGVDKSGIRTFLRDHRRETFPAAETVCGVSVTQIVVICLLLVMVCLQYVFLKKYKLKVMTTSTSRLELVECD